MVVRVDCSSNSEYWGAVARKERCDVLATVEDGRSVRSGRPATGVTDRAPDRHLRRRQILHHSLEQLQ